MDAQPDAQDPQTPAEIEAAPPSRPPLWRRFGVWVTVGVVLYIIGGAILLVKVPDRLLAHWFPTLDESARAAFLGPAANVVLFGLGGTIAVVGVGLSLSRHRQELEAAERDRQRLVDDQARERARQVEVDVQRRIDTERALRERFVTTVKLLSDPAPVNRQAALFALGALADDWHAFEKPEEVQVCIEVLTGYLRAPRTDDMLVPLTQEQLDTLSREERHAAQRTTAQEISVKQAGYTVIRNHLAGQAAPHWHDRRIDLSDAHIDFRIGLQGATVSGSGRMQLAGATVGPGGRVDLEGATISDSGRVDLGVATINRGWVNLKDATISDGGKVDLMWTTVTGGEVNLEGATIIDDGQVNLTVTTMNDAQVILEGATIDGGLVDLMWTTVTGGEVNLKGATISDGGKVDLTGVTISDAGRVDFGAATIGDGGKVDLTGVTIGDDAKVDLTSVTVSGDGQLVHEAI
ncbi:hypothetical protein [Microbacterium sp. C7(2022)]|uniref:hypothetical protein n=1 Tax=Microbacterium sp. C7(2022) TaxID=2992759 RepID=UPI00237C11AC|nr:hypothetical protein [Microbacterium sp. C7(2022)]MDE0547556.1 hypothetical protein [Microbacterium sp. C7(2022)]